MPVQASDNNPERARRFREARTAYLDDAYTLARYLLRNAADAEDAVRDITCAFKHFDSYRGPAMKPWLFAILRNVCRAEYARRTSHADDRRGRGTAGGKRKRRRCGTRPRRRRRDRSSAPKFRHRPPADRSPGRAVSRASCAVQGFFLPRDRRRRGGARRYRDVAPRARRAMLRSAWMAEQNNRNDLPGSAEMLLHPL